MWNSLKSDVYRTLHSRSFLVITFLVVLTTISMVSDIGIMSNSIFAGFARHENTFADFLYFLPKSAVFNIMILMYVVLFSCDEYSSGYVKNMFPLHRSKWKLLLERYFYALILIFFFIVVGDAVAFLTKLINPLTSGTVVFTDILLYNLMQTILLGAVASFLTLLIHISRSKVIGTLIVIAYSMMLVYMLHSLLIGKVPGMVDYLPYTLYVLSGKLPYVFSWEAYQTALLVGISSTLLYQAISLMILNRKDI